MKHVKIDKTSATLGSFFAMETVNCSDIVWTSSCDEWVSIGHAEHERGLVFHYNNSLAMENPECSRMIPVLQKCCRDCVIRTFSTGRYLAADAGMISVVTAPPNQIINPRNFANISISGISPGIPFRIDVCAYDYLYQLDVMYRHGVHALSQSCPQCLVGVPAKTFGSAYPGDDSRRFDIYSDIPLPANNTHAPDYMGCVAFDDVMMRLPLNHTADDLLLIHMVTDGNPSLCTHDIKLKFNICPPGFGVIVDGSGKYKTCATCTDDTYSYIDGGHASCININCGRHMKCPGGAVVHAEPDYWIYRDYDTGVATPYRCPPTLCKGSEVCAVHRNVTHHLCGTCDLEYSVWMDECTHCPDTYNILLISLLILAAWGNVGVIVTLAQSEAGLFSILAYYCQSAAMILAPASLFDIGVSKIMNFQFEQVLVLGSGHQGSSCPFARDGIGLIQSNLLMPVLSLVLLCVTAGVHALGVRLLVPAESRDCYEVLRRYGRGLFALIASTYQIIVVWTSNYLDCRSAGDVDILWTGPDVVCDSDRYLSMQPLFMIFAIYLIIVPIVLLVLIRNSLKTIENEAQLTEKLLDGGDDNVNAVEHSRTKRTLLTASLQVLQSAYTKKRYYWECAILLRKFVFVIVYVLVSRLTGSSSMVALGCFAVESINLALHVAVRPLRSSKANILEFVSHLTLALVSAAAGSQAYIEGADDTFSAGVILYSLVHLLATGVLYVIVVVVVADALAPRVRRLNMIRIERSKSEGVMMSS